MNVLNLYFSIGMQQVLEAVMLVCFGVAWPCASLRILRTGRAQSNGLGFTLVILCGYLFGASSKMLVALRGAELAPVFWLYAVNAVSVAVNLGLQLQYGRRRDEFHVGARASQFLGMHGTSPALKRGPTLQSNSQIDNRTGARGGGCAPRSQAQTIMRQRRRSPYDIAWHHGRRSSATQQRTLRVTRSHRSSTRSQALATCRVLAS